MDTLSPPLQFLLLMFGWVNRRQADVIATCRRKTAFFASNSEDAVSV